MAPENMFLKINEFYENNKEELSEFKRWEVYEYIAEEFKVSKSTIYNHLRNNESMNEITRKRNKDNKYFSSEFRDQKGRPDKSKQCYDLLNKYPNVSISELSRRTGIARRTISKYKKGQIKHGKTK